MRKTGFAVVALAAAVIVALLAVGIQAGADARPQRYVVVYSPSATKELKAAVSADFRAASTSPKEPRHWVRFRSPVDRFRGSPRSRALRAPASR